MLVVDSSVWIDLIRQINNPHTSLLAQMVTRQGIALTDLILCEVLQGIADEGSFQKTQVMFHRFHVLDGGGEAIAVQAARNYRYLRAKGITVRKTVDCLIATYCLMEGHMLLHCDRDFDAFEQYLGLNVLHPPRLN